jgi:uncharacterized membrane protein
MVMKKGTVKKGKSLLRLKYEKLQKSYNELLRATASRPSLNSGSGHCGTGGGGGAGHCS